MSTDLLKELVDSSASSNYLGNFTSLNPAATSYGLDLGEMETGLGNSPHAEIAPERPLNCSEYSSLKHSTALLEASETSLLLDGGEINALTQPAINADVLTGIEEGEPLLLNPDGAAVSSDTIRGSLDFSDYFNPTRLYAYKDDYLLTSPVSGSVQINLDSWQFDAYLQLVDATTGRLLAFDDDSSSGTNAQLSFTAQAGEQYLIRATSYWSFEVGGYSLTAQLGSGGQPTPPTPPSDFDSAYGYGLVNAAAVIAETTGQSLPASSDTTSNQWWNNEMVNAPDAWAQGYTGQNVTVAVIDSGVDIYHEDLRGNIWVNTDEVLGDGIDNDGNGYIDDRYGWNFGIGQNNNNVLPGTNDFGQGHGTHVAGTIAAANNGIGMTGVAYNADIMSIRMGDVAGGSFVNGGDLAQAIRYAVDNGADVINMSLGWSDPTGSIRDALAYAASQNVIAVTAAGNSSLSAPGSPAYYATDYGISVGAVDINGNITSFSNRAGNDSRMHHVMAPGQDIYSTLPGDRYGNSNGTSMAAPHVAGVIALMLSANPNLTHDQVREMLIGAADLNSVSTNPSATINAELAELSNDWKQSINKTSELGAIALASHENDVNLGALETVDSILTQEPIFQVQIPELAIADAPAPTMEHRSNSYLNKRSQLQGDDWLTHDWLANQQSLLADDLIGSLTA
ncbi:MAG: S8 family serine peptidase [Leptolyngbya sp. SIOISBB]|nr:S8 family serine peptidase [Leptolyngbya sp. SIOISBB]